jgi:hypothetical protein
LRTITIYSRPECHLCDQAYAIVMSLQDILACEVRVVDIDQDRDLVARYGTRIPVVSLEGSDVLAWPFTRAQALAVLRQRLDSQ